MYLVRDRHSLSHVTALNLGLCSYVERNDVLMVLLMIHVMSFSVTLLCSETTGYLDEQFGTVLSLLGRCFIRNLYIKERSLKLNSFGFFMSSKAFSKKIFIRSLGSTLTICSWYPMNIWLDSSLFTSANASLSTGAYRDFMSLVNQELARINFVFSSSWKGTIISVWVEDGTVVARVGDVVYHDRKMFL